LHNDIFIYQIEDGVSFSQENNARLRSSKEHIAFKPRPIPARLFAVLGMTWQIQVEVKFAPIPGTRCFECLLRKKNLLRISYINPTTNQRIL